MMLKICLIIFAVFAGLFVLSFIVYFFNLDMKLAAAATPLINKIYDRRKKKEKEKKEAREKESQKNKE